MSGWRAVTFHWVAVPLSIEVLKVTCLEGVIPGAAK
jgi:hypothetical protein